MFGGDDSLIKRQVGIIFVLTAIVVVLACAFGLIHLMPQTLNDSSCTYRYHPIYSGRFIQIDEPILPRSCNG